MEGIEVILTWTLVHSLWIAMAIWVFANMLSTFFNGSAARRLIKIISLTLFMVLTLVALFREMTTEVSLQSIIPGLQTSNSFDTSLNWFDQVNDWVGENSFIITVLWLAGTFTGMIRYLLQRKSLNLCKTSAIISTDENAISLMQNIRKALGINRPVSVRISSLINSPMTAGVLKPVIYFPVGLISGLSTDELETILRHELTHIKRHDYLINLYLVLLETLFFFNPVILLMVRELRREMEYVCDDEVLKSHEQLAYAKALLKLQENSLSSQVALAAQNNNSEFKNRIERIIHSREPKSRYKTGVVVLLAFTLLVSSAFVKNTSPEVPETIAVQQDTRQETKQDTLRAKDKEELLSKIRGLGLENIGETVLYINKERVRVKTKVESNALSIADKMMEEIHQELINDGILNENRKRIVLMFQYSDLLNGESSLGNKYQKYKAIFNRYFPGYDTFATTRAFSLPTHMT